jgi:hypothetical protein
MSTEQVTGQPAAEEPGERSPLELAADLLVYVPVGLAVAARDLLPTLAERGRTEVASQVSLARMVGQLVVRQGQDELGRAVGGARQQVGTLFGQFLRALGDDDEAVDEPPAAPVPAPAPAARAAAPVRASAAVAVAPPAAEGRGSADAPLVAALAIPDYDSLAASQVIPRLAALAPDELEAIRHYEASTRGRRTVLGRIAQLQG